MAAEDEQLNPKMADLLCDPEFKARAEKLTVDELVVEFAASRERLEAAKKAKSRAQMEYDYLRGVLLPKRMEDAGVDLIRPKDGRGVRIGTSLIVAVDKANRAALQQWLRENNAESLITETVNASSLKAFVKSALQSGRPVPGEEIAKIQALPIATFC